MSHSEKTAAMYYQHIGQVEQRTEAYNAIFSIKKRNRISSSEDEPESEPEPQPAETKVKRMKFTDEEVDAMKKFFREVRKSLLDRCRVFLSAYPDVNRTAKQIQDKLKQL